MSKIHVGEVAVLKATFAINSTATDPATPVTISIKDPDGSLVIDEQSATKDSTGVFIFNYTTQKPGMHTYSFKSDDPAIEEGEFLVHTSKVN